MAWGAPSDAIRGNIFSSADHDFQCYEGRFSSKDTPVAKYIADRVLTLPLYADLALEDVDRICGLLREMG